MAFPQDTYKGLRLGRLEDGLPYGADLEETIHQVDAFVHHQWAQDRRTTSGLTYGYIGGMNFDGAAYSQIPDGTVTLADNATNYVERDSAGNVTTNTTGWTSGRTPMAKVTTVTGAITDVTDSRPLATTVGGGGGGGIGGSGTAGTIAKFVSPFAIGNSIMSETGTTVTVAGILLAATALIGGADPGGTAPLRALTAGGPQARLAYSGSVYTEVQTDASGHVTITPTGARMVLAGNLWPSGTRALGDATARWNALYAVTIDASGAGSFNSLTLTTPLATTSGGTGLAAWTAGDLPYYASGTVLSKLALGTTGHWLGAGATAPQYNAPAALTKADDTNVTVALGGSPSTALLNATSLTLGWTGQLAVARGGLGLSTITAFGTLYASAANTYAVLAPNTTTTKMYLSMTGTGAAGQAPAWAQVAFGDVSGTLAYSQLPTGSGSWDAGAGATTTITRALTVAGALTAQAGLTVTGGSISASGIAATVGALTATTGTFSGLLRRDVLADGTIGEGIHVLDTGTYGPDFKIKIGSAAGLTQGTGEGDLIVYGPSNGATEWRHEITSWERGYSFALGSSAGTKVIATLTTGGGGGAGVSHWGRLRLYDVTDAQVGYTNDSQIGTGTANVQLSGSASAASWVLGSLGIGTTTPSARADIVGATYQLSVATIQTDATAKAGRIVSRHYTNAEEPLGLIIGYTDATDAIVSIGGGESVVNAAKDIKFYTAANNTTTMGTLAGLFNSSQNLLLGTPTGATGNPRLDVVGTIGLVVTDSTANATNKAGRIGVRHYTNAEEPVALILGFPAASSSIVAVGGGSSALNAATQINFYAAANTTTVTGTVVGYVTTSGWTFNVNVLPGTNDAYKIGDLGTGFQRVVIQHAVNRADGLILRQTATGAMSPRIFLENTTDWPNAGIAIAAIGANTGTLYTNSVAGSSTGTGRVCWDATALYPADADGYALGKSTRRWSTGYFSTSVLAPTLGSGGNVDLTLQRNAVTKLILGSTQARFIDLVVADSDIGLKDASVMYGHVGATSFHEATFQSANLYYSGSGDPFAAGNWRYINAAGANNAAGGLFIIKGNGTETGVDLRFFTVPTSTGAGATPASMTERLRYNNGAWTFSGSGTFTGLIQTTVTTEQLRLRYDASNYLSVTVGSTGIITYDAVGAGAKHTFNDDFALTQGLSLDVESFSSSPTLGSDDCVALVDASAADRTVTLPAAASHTGRLYYVKKKDTSSGLVTIDGNASETIDGATTLVLSAPYQSATLISDGSNWHIL